MTKVALAAIAGAHGVRGEVRLKLFTDTVASLARHKAVLVGGQPMTLEKAAGTAKSPTARLAGVGSREAAEALRGQLIEVERAALPPLEEGEYYHADLLGLAVVDGEGSSLGTVVAVENFGAGDLLEVADTAGKRALVPFRPGIADLVDGKVVIDPAFLA
ncbi:MULTISPECIES: ribosome maturation factor RimM [Sphingomonas]|uniref:ribosome maturation factor RimM n=1 Tax=Sphingomonas TaxID=13687 RepID=UPI000DF0130B|nr:MULTISPECIES: ribosome maturation factor RimM [Sphingomonas]